jgi:hypothetical protein
MLSVGAMSACLLRVVAPRSDPIRQAMGAIRAYEGTDPGAGHSARQGIAHEADAPGTLAARAADATVAATVTEGEHGHDGARRKQLHAPTGLVIILRCGLQLREWR